MFLESWHKFFNDIVMMSLKSKKFRKAGNKKAMHPVSVSIQQGMKSPECFLNKIYTSHIKLILNIQ